MLGLMLGLAFVMAGSHRNQKNIGISHQASTMHQKPPEQEGWVGQ